MSGMIPDITWGTKHRLEKQEEADQTLAQRLVCYPCLVDGHVHTPDQIVMVGGYSYCVPHAKAGRVR